MVAAAAETAIVASAASGPCRRRAASAPAAAAAPETEAAEEVAADRHHEIEVAQNDAAAAVAVQAGGEALSSSSSSAASPAGAAAEIEILQGAEPTEPAQVMPTLALILVLADASERAIRHLAARGRFRPAQVHKLELELELELEAAVAGDRGRSDKCIRIRPSSSSSRVEDLEVPVRTITKGREIATPPSIARSASRVVAAEEEGGAAEA